MELFLRLIQGSYAYLLVFQILVVTGLVLTLISLIVRRTREAHALAGGGVSTDSHAISASAPMMVVDDGKIQELEAKLAALEDENGKFKASSADAKTLREKVKYLESKLLEYEILQEEIGTLSALKVENEQLRKELVQTVKKTPPSPPREDPGPIIEPPPAVPPVTVFFDPPPIDEATKSGDPAQQGEVAASGLENLLQQIDDLATPANEDGESGGGGTGG